MSRIPFTNPFTGITEMMPVPWGSEPASPGPDMETWLPFRNPVTGKTEMILVPGRQAAPPVAGTLPIADSAIRESSPVYPQVQSPWSPSMLPAPYSSTPKRGDEIQGGIALAQAPMRQPPLPGPVSQPPMPGPQVFGDDTPIQLYDEAGNPLPDEPFDPSVVQLYERGPGGKLIPSISAPSNPWAFLNKGLDRLGVHLGYTQSIQGGLESLADRLRQQNAAFGASGQAPGGQDAFAAEMQRNQQEVDRLRRENAAIEYALQVAYTPRQFAHIHGKLLEKRGGGRTPQPMPMEEVAQLPNVYEQQKANLSPLAGLSFPMPQAPPLTPQEQAALNAYQAWHKDFRVGDIPKIHTLEREDPAIYMQQAQAAGQQAARGESPTSWPGAWQGPMTPGERPRSTGELLKERSPEAYTKMQERVTGRREDMQQGIDQRWQNVRARAAGRSPAEQRLEEGGTRLADLLAAYGPEGAGLPGEQQNQYAGYLASALAAYSAMEGATPEGAQQFVESFKQAAPPPMPGFGTVQPPLPQPMQTPSMVTGSPRLPEGASIEAVLDAIGRLDLATETGRASAVQLMQKHGITQDKIDEMLNELEPTWFEKTFYPERKTTGFSGAFNWPAAEFEKQTRAQRQSLLKRLKTI